MVAVGGIKNAEVSILVRRIDELDGTRYIGHAVTHSALHASVDMRGPRRVLVPLYRASEYGFQMGSEGHRVTGRTHVFMPADSVL